MTEEDIYSVIINYFENHTNNRLDGQTFILKCMGKLEKIKDETIIDNSLILLEHYLDGDIIRNSYNNLGIPLNKLTTGDKEALTCILEQEFIPSQEG